MSPAGALVRVQRTISVLFGVAALVFGLLDLPAVEQQSASLPPLWTALALAGTLGLPVLLGALGALAPVRVLRGLAVAVAASHLLALLSVPLVYRGAPTTDVSPWLLQLTALGTTAAALSLPAGPVAADLVLTAVLVVVGRTLTTGEDLGPIPVQDGLYALLFSGVFAALAVGALAAGRAVDAAARDAEAAEVREQEQLVRLRERDRVHALVHDHVLATLLVAGRSPGPSEPAAAAAAEALGRLRELDAGRAGPAAVAPDELVARVRAAATSIAAAAAVVVVRSGPGPATVGTDAADAIVGAVCEALQNSLRHAGPDAAIELHVEVGDGSVDIAVIDDGAGFDPARVPARRLGLARSVVRRMRAAGGDAEVRSVPGQGTAVRVRWPA